MSQPDPGEPDPTPPPGQRDTPWALIATATVAALVLVIGFVVWVGGSDDEITSTSTATTTSVVTTTIESSTTSTSSTTTTMPATTSTPTTTTAATTTVPTTSSLPSTTVPEPPTGDTWTITSQYFPDDPFTLTRVAQVERLTAYDGAIDVGPPGLRCVAIVIDGDDGWSEWCGESGRSSNFVVLDGIDPWLVEVGAEPGALTLTRREPTWSLPSNGCTAPMTALIAAGPYDPAVLTGIVCVPGEAFASYSSVLLQQGPADGGGALITEGDEGWATIDTGTSLGCEAGADGIDRCALYGVEFELFEALLPIPPDDMLTDAPDIIAVRDETAELQAWVGAETEPPEIEGIILDFLVDADAEVPADIRRAAGVSYAEALDLVIVEVPAMDDSILSETWAIWIDTASPAPLVRVSAWGTCARGLAGPDVCV